MKQLLALIILGSVLAIGYTNCGGQGGGIDAGGTVTAPTRSTPRPPSGTQSTPTPTPFVPTPTPTGTAGPTPTPSATPTPRVSPTPTPGGGGTGCESYPPPSFNTNAAFTITSSQLNVTGSYPSVSSYLQAIQNLDVAACHRVVPEGVTNFFEQNCRATQLRMGFGPCSTAFLHNSIKYRVVKQKSDHKASSWNCNLMDLL